MTQACERFRSDLPAYLDDALAGETRTELRRHLGDCGMCRQFAVEREPSLLFAAPAVEAVDLDERESRQILEAVRGAVALRQAAARLEKPHAGRAPGRAAAAAIAAAAVGSLLFWSLPRHHTAPGQIAAVAPVMIPQATAAVTLKSSGSRPVFPQAPGDTAVTPASATVYEWTPASGDVKDPKIVWIVDRSLDI